MVATLASALSLGARTARVLGRIWNDSTDVVGGLGDLDAVTLAIYCAAVEGGLALTDELKMRIPSALGKATNVLLGCINVVMRSTWLIWTVGLPVCA